MNDKHTKKRVPRIELSDEQCRSAALAIHRYVREQRAFVDDLERRLAAGERSGYSSADIPKKRADLEGLKDAAIKLLDYGDEVVRLETGRTVKEREILDGASAWAWWEERSDADERETAARTLGNSEIADPNGRVRR